MPGPEPGILDLYTVLKGLLVAAALAIQGANYIAMKAEGKLYKRACWIARLGGWMLVLLVIVNLFTLHAIQPILSYNFSAYPIGYLIPVAAAIALGRLLYFRQKGRDVAAFFASSLFILGILGTTAWGYYPNLLIATTDHSYSLTVYNSAVSPYGFGVGLIWFLIGFSLVVTYTVYMHRCFWGKVGPPSADNNH